MIIVLDTENPAISPALVDPETFTEFSVRIVGPPVSDPRRIFPSLGHWPDAGHVFIDPETVRALADTLTDDPAWRSGFEKMYDFAQRKGWTNQTGAIRAHVDTGSYTLSESASE